MAATGLPSVDGGRPPAEPVRRPDGGLPAVDCIARLTALVARESTPRAMQAPLQWRRFNFFEKELVRKGDVPHPLVQKLQVTCVGSAKGQLLFGDVAGVVHMIDSEFSADRAFSAFERTVTLVEQVKRSPLLLALGEDDDVIDPTVKIFHTERLDEHQQPSLWKALKISNRQQLFPVTCMSLMEDLSCVALGLCNGAVVLFYTADGSTLVYEKNVRQKYLLPKDVNPITGLHFSRQSRHLFICSSAAVKCFALDSEEMTTCDEDGAELGNSVLSDEGQLVVVRKEAVFVYDTDGRATAYPLESEKKMTCWFRHYLVIVGKETEGDMNTLSVYDLKNKLVAFSGAFQNIAFVFTDAASNLLYVLCRDGKLYQLDENDIQTKLETLFKKNLYQLAVSLAQSHGCEAAVVTDIYKRAGDHLYSKGDFDGAIQQYVHTIGGLEASYVIMKFLDAARIHNLTAFLQALHERRAAGPEHTTLLLSCYTKLKDVNQIDLFISADWTFSAETAIVVCRQSAYFPQALALAKKHREHEWVLVEDFKDPAAALVYLAGLPPHQTEKSLKEYGAQLAACKPDEVESLLERLFRKVDEADPDDYMRQTAKSLPEEFIHVFVRHSQWLIRFLEFVLAQQQGSKLLYNTLLEMYLQDVDLSSVSAEQQTQRKKDYLNRAYSILTDPSSNYYPEQALILCELHRFQAGALYLYEKMKLYNEILQFYMNKFDYDNVLVTCRRHGQHEANLWVRALFYFVVMDEPCENEIREVMTAIEKENLLPPVQAVQILAQKKTVPMGMVKEYVLSRLDQFDRVVQENKKQIGNYMEEIERMRADIEEFRHAAKTIQAAKCSACHAPLDLPAVHFLCGHSFHTHCLQEGTDECMVCASATKQLFETKRSLETAADQHDKFMRQLEGATDGFVTCAEYFGRHIFAGCEPLALPSDRVSQQTMEQELMIHERRNPKKRPDVVKVVPSHVGGGGSSAAASAAAASASAESGRGRRDGAPTPTRTATAAPSADQMAATSNAVNTLMM